MDEDNEQSVFQELGQNFLQSLSARGMSLDGWLQAKRISSEEFIAEQHRQANDFARESLALDALARELKVEFSVEFSGSCAGCAETAYARLVTQVCGDRMFISNATGSSSIWGNPAATSPFCTDANGHGPAWTNSLFEDNAEHGLGRELGYKAVQGTLVARSEELMASDCATDELKAAAQAWIDSRDDVEASKTAAAAYISGSCAGCAETAYARLVTQVCGDRMFISNATGCSSIWGNPAATSPFCTDANGHGPAWNNSLFEDNAEHGLGLELGYKAVQGKLVAETDELMAGDCATDELKAAAQDWIDSREDVEASKTAAAAYIEQLEACGCDKAKAILADKAYLTKKSFWIFGGDGWAYDIGFGGLDHVLASGNNVNVFVFDTDNTGGQASKASNLGQVAQFAAAGKNIKKKSLAEIAMSYGYEYVAQVDMGANAAQTLKAIHEAESYDGPSIIIGYSPCERHSIKQGGMQNCQAEM